MASSHCGVLVVWTLVCLSGVSAAGCPELCSCPSEDQISCSSLELRKLPVLIGVHVTKVDLSVNLLEEIPTGSLEKLPHLLELNLSDNRLSAIPLEAFRPLTQLRVLHLQGNVLTSPLGLEPLTALRFLDLSHNRISSISAGNLDDLRQLETLILANNDLRDVDDRAFTSLSLLSRLDLKSNRLIRVPKAIGTLSFLQSLNLAQNSISSVPSGILQNCSLLQSIDLKGNPLSQVEPDAFAALPHLKQLIISDVKNMSVFLNLNGTHSLELLRLDRAKLEKVPESLCQTCPRLKSLNLKSNRIAKLPDLNDCQELKLLDLSRNEIRLLSLDDEDTDGPLNGHNRISKIWDHTFKGLSSLQVLDLYDNLIEDIEGDAFMELTSLHDLNLGKNRFARFPRSGLKGLTQLKTHNNPELKDFPGAARFPNIQHLVLSYAYHCCQFLPSTYENRLPEYSDWGHLQESVFFPGDEGFMDTSLWNDSSVVWSQSGDGSKQNLTDSDYAPSSFYDHKMMSVMPHSGIHCMPAPGPFLPCNDLFDWWTLRCSVWIVFLLALLGNGCVVFVLIAARGKMDVPRFLVCNLAAADFFMGLYLGFLAIVDASTLGEFRRFAIRWQFSTGCQVAGFFGVLSSELSVFTLAVITLERNYAITHAMHLNKRLSLRHASYIMIAGWTFSLLMASMPLIGISDYKKFAVCLPFETGDPLSLGYVVFLMLINGVAFSILMGCYLKMYCAIRGSQAWNSNDSRIAKRMALLVFTDFLCWAPIAFFALTASFGLHLISLEQAKVFTIFILPLNSCCNPFLYAILTKQFKKDCVMICKAIEESRVTRGIGRCRHSSNFSNRQTPANTNSLHSGSGTHHHPIHSKGTLCSCNAKLVKTNQAGVLATKWPFNKLRNLILGFKEPNATDQSGMVANSEYAQQIADIQQKQQKAKRHASLSSDNFSSSRSDSWRLHGAFHNHHHPHCLHQTHAAHHVFRQSGAVNAAALTNAAPQGRRRRNSWTVTRKPSQDSQLSSSRNDSHASNSTQTWRMSRSSVSSDMSNSAASKASKSACNGASLSSTSSANPASTAVKVQGTRAVGGACGVKGRGQMSLVRIASENCAASQGKPKLMRQSAILADGDSSSSGKSVHFQEPAGLVGARKLISVATEVGACPLHCQELRCGTIYEKLAESSHENSDMELSDSDIDEGNIALPVADTAEEACRMSFALRRMSQEHTRRMEDEEEQQQQSTDENICEDASELPQLYGDAVVKSVIAQILPVPRDTWDGGPDAEGAELNPLLSHDDTCDKLPVQKQAGAAKEVEAVITIKDSPSSDQESEVRKSLLGNRRTKSSPKTGTKKKYMNTIV